MADGAAALNTLEPPSAPVQSQAQDKPAIELESAQAVADAVCVIRSAVDHCLQNRTFALDPEIRCEGGTMIARVVMLQLDHEGGDADFIDKARDAGRRVLRQRFAATDVHLIDAWLDDLFIIVGPVVRDERIFRLARSN